MRVTTDNTMSFDFTYEELQERLRAKTGENALRFGPLTDGNLMGTVFLTMSPNATAGAVADEIVRQKTALHGHFLRMDRRTKSVYVPRNAVVYIMRDKYTGGRDT